MSRLRVVFSIGALHGGGSERQLVSLLRHLDRDRFEPFLYLVYRMGPLLSLVPDDVPVTSFAERARASRLYLPGLMHRRRVQDMAEYLREVRADLSYDRTFLMTLISAAAAQRAGIPSVSTIVTNPETGFAPVAGRFQWFKRRMLRRLYDQSARVLAVSEGARASAIRFYGIRPDNVLTLPNGVDVDLLQQQAQVPVTDSWWNHHSEGSAGKRVLRLVTAGRLNEHKGFHFLIPAVAEVQDRNPDCEIRLAILGEGDWRDRLQAQIRQLNLESHVQLVGFCSNAAAWYQSAHAFVLPSLMEGMPNVLLEAMALGTPVISADCPSGPQEILQGGELGRLVSPASSHELAAAISELIHDPAVVSARAEKARSEIDREYSIRIACRRLEDVFTAAVSRDSLNSKS